MNNHYLRRGTGKVLWTPKLCDPRHPTLCELRDAYDLTCDLTSEVAGLDPLHTTIERTNVWSAHNTSIVAVAPAQTPTLTLLDREDNQLFHLALFTEAKEGWLILLPHGKIEEGARVDVIHCQSAGYQDSWTFALQPATIIVRLAALSETVRATVIDGEGLSYSFDPSGVAVVETGQEFTRLDGEPYVGDTSQLKHVSVLGIGVIFADRDGRVVVSSVSPVTGGTVFTRIGGSPWAGDYADLRRLSVTGTSTGWYTDPSGAVVGFVEDKVTGEMSPVLVDGTPYLGDVDLLTVIESRGGI